MDLGLSNKRVLVTGASRGIGLAIARGFLNEGARVALIARTDQLLAEATVKLSTEHGSDRVLKITADCADAKAWPEVVSRIESVWGGLDITVANVGDGRSVADALPDEARFKLTWQTNFATAEQTARYTLPLLEMNRGCLLFIASITGLEAIGAPTDYSVAKAALIVLSKQLARKLATGVRVNCLAPGNVYVPGGSWDEKIQVNRERVERLIEATVPMRRFGTPDEIADAAVFLCSDRASFITGTCLVVDGGQTVRYS
jgi:3-oxoacyl-[acyl-carrier protein] reductase